MKKLKILILLLGVSIGVNCLSIGYHALNNHALKAQVDQLNQQINMVNSSINSTRSELAQMAESQKWVQQMSMKAETTPEGQLTYVSQFQLTEYTEGSEVTLHIQWPDKHIVSYPVDPSKDGFFICRVPVSNDFKPTLSHNFWISDGQNQQVQLTESPQPAFETTELTYFITVKIGDQVQTSQHFFDSIDYLNSGLYYRTHLETGISSGLLTGSLSFSSESEKPYYTPVSATIIAYNKGTQVESLAIDIEDNQGYGTTYYLDQMQYRFKKPFDQMDIKIEHQADGKAIVIQETVWKKE